MPDRTPGTEPLVLPADPDLPVPYTVVTSGWHRPDVETAALEHLTSVVGPVSARQIVDGLLARGKSQAGTAKDTPRRESTLDSAVLDLLAAIRDHTNVPLPGLNQADEHAYQRLMTTRLGELHSSLKVALSEKWVDIFDPAAETAYIRRRTAGSPVTYGLWADTPSGGAL